MTIDYHQEIINLINNNSISYAPSAELMNASEEIALAVWKSFYVPKGYYDSFDLDEWYSKGDWALKLNSYKDNLSFWEKALENKNFKYEILFNKKFQEDFPNISTYYLTNKEKLIYLFNKTSDTTFFELLDISQEEKDTIYKDYLLKQYRVSGSDITKYENDSKFVIDLLKKEPGYYLQLNEENRNNIEYINLTLIQRKSLQWVPKDKEISIFKKWYELHKPMIYGDEIRTLNKEELDFLLKEQPDLISDLTILQLKYFENFLISDLTILQLKDFENLALNLLEKNFSKYSKYLRQDQLNYLFIKEDKSNFEKIKPLLKEAINSYNYVGPEDKTQEKFIRLVSLDNSLLDLLNENIFYKINLACKKEITSEQFYNFFDILYDKYKQKETTSDVVDYTMTVLHSKFSIETAKKEKLSKKHLFKRLCMNRLNIDLDKEVLNTSPKRNKI